MFGRLLPCALALLCLTGRLAPATGKPYTSDGWNLFNDHGDAMERQEMINNGRLYETNGIQQLRLQMHKMIRKGVKPMSSRRSGSATHYLWQACPTTLDICDLLVQWKLFVDTSSIWQSRDHIMSTFTAGVNPYPRAFTTRIHRKLTSNK